MKIKSPVTNRWITVGGQVYMKLLKAGKVDNFEDNNKYYSIEGSRSKEDLSKQRKKLKEMHPDKEISLGHRGTKDLFVVKNKRKYVKKVQKPVDTYRLHARNLINAIKTMPDDPNKAEDYFADLIRDNKLIDQDIANREKFKVKSNRPKVKVTKKKGKSVNVNGYSIPKDYIETSDIEEERPLMRLKKGGKKKIKHDPEPEYEEEEVETSEKDNSSQDTDEYGYEYDDEDYKEVKEKPKYYKFSDTTEDTEDTDIPTQEDEPEPEVKEEKSSFFNGRGVTYE
ncbi:MAG: hypothetical protein OEL89_00605 [Candidatus Peregrinibacteria bacterium]|nr:hypothetical protein [Candidatus Peregrinibacteria bacterium]